MHDVEDDDSLFGEELKTILSDHGVKVTRQLLENLSRFVEEKVSLAESAVANSYYDICSR